MNKRVKLLKPGRLAGGLSVLEGTICVVERRYDENDFYSKGRPTLDVVKDDMITFTVFEDEVEYV